MCNECNLTICDSRCPYSDNFESFEEISCCECGRDIEFGEEYYTSKEDEVFCYSCLNNLTTEDIIRYFLYEGVR